ncbi:serine/threonine protein kinase [Hoyosella rhizosphaerae]|uniref:non-specific serine/threonine protein kinase n=1 Tax=Hoyosella rhizosphaerae TaxID=1755582 RepID=A0A916XDQ6_9ACTN|nr:serine/threonine-protein kinase [Hoyosella rhizosphaerae]MBN4927455.1 serine/threonine protein kinase [Hoyosella rhizosphaerae]GGC64274.1 serine/threonine protein kinase [Hoyosella rhizosphaerae]
MTLHSGTIIADRYRLQRFIASGGMGEVWEALDTRLDRRVAVKVVKPEVSSDSEFLIRFRAEAKTTAQLHHPSIASVFDYGETHDDDDRAIAYLVMELVNGEPLNTVLARMGSIPLPLALDMLEQTGKALQVAHDAGLVHRDVKPGNILITPSGQVKITDFGIAKAVDAAPVTRTGHVMGTAQYISPEQASGQPATSASDVYSLGIVGYEAIAGRRPFVGEGVLTVAMKHIHETPPPLPGDVPKEVRTLIDVALSKDPKTRYKDGGSFAAAVADARAGRQPDDPRGAKSGGFQAIVPMATPASTQVLPTTQRPQLANQTVAYRGYGANSYGANSYAYAPPPETGFSTGQKILAWGAAAIFVLVGITTAILLVSNMLDNRVPVAPPTQPPVETVEPEPIPEPPVETPDPTTEPVVTTPPETTEPDEPDETTEPDEPTNDVTTENGPLSRILPGRGNSANRIFPDEIPVIDETLLPEAPEVPEP